MKLGLVTLISFLTFFSNANAQSVSPTTEEEYNYLTRGYKVQIESGLDMKKGYEFEDIIEDKKIGSYIFTIKGLKRQAKKEIAALLVITQSSVSGKTYYHCIPQGNDALTQRYLKEIDSWDYSILKAYSSLTATIVGGLIPYMYELEKKSVKK